MVYTERGKDKVIIISLVTNINWTSLNINPIYMNKNGQIID